MKPTPEEIEAALANYRKITAERNKRVLQVYVDAIVNAEFEDERIASEYTEEEMHKERMEQLGELVEDDLDGLTQPTELIERYDEMAAKLYLDGTPGGDLDPEARANLVEPYFKALEAALREKAPDEVKETISAPEEIRVLARHVTGILGSGLPHEQTMHGMSFWSDEGMGNHAKIPSRILAPDQVGGAQVVDGRIALGYHSGSTVNCEWTCVYAQEPDDSWAWKYLWSDPSQWKVFDTITELLEWFLDFTDEPPPLLEGVTAEDVIDRMVYDLASPSDQPREEE